MGVGDGGLIGSEGEQPVPIRDERGITVRRVASHPMIEVVNKCYLDEGLMIVRTRHADSVCPVVQTG